MLGLVLSGNIAMVFVFWELVGICSYFLIGFYVERKSASTAANKAFIVNRIGDFGFIIGLMALWTTLGTFSFGDVTKIDKKTGKEVEQLGIFSQVRPPGLDHELRPTDTMVLEDARAESKTLYRELSSLGASLTQQDVQRAIDARLPAWRERENRWGIPYGRWILIIAGVGIFCGCVGKSAQFPLHVWLPDAMEGPTPVSALVHSATMVAAGVYLVGRFYPVFTPEVLWVISVIGCITLFMAATIAITATDIKRVLAYSTVSQLGYMMLALGVGGWLAGMMHLITHAFFKSLLFLCSGSVIHAVHTNEMTQMGGLWKKMPITAITMLVGCLAIAGAGIPFVVGFSGYYSKDMILEQAFSLFRTNGPGSALVFFVFAAGGAAITSFYMFRMWYMTFAGHPRDHHRYDHAHESPPVMWVPLAILSVFAVGVAWQPIDAFYFIMIAGVAWLVVFMRSLATGVPDRKVMLQVAAGIVVLAVVVGAWSAKPVALQNLIAQGRPAGTLPAPKRLMNSVANAGKVAAALVVQHHPVRQAPDDLSRGRRGGADIQQIVMRHAIDHEKFGTAFDLSRRRGDLGHRLGPHEQRREASQSKQKSEAHGGSFATALILPCRRFESAF
jgi:NADH-quinone oxidoreductase subunit L